MTSPMFSSPTPTPRVGTATVYQPPDPSQAGSASAVVRAFLQRWKLESLEPAVRGMLVKGDSEDVVMMKLRETPEYKRRFKANADRIAKGLAPLTEAEYISNEDSYREAMQRYGLPTGFYDSDDDFTKFIANGISPQSVLDRVTLAAERYVNADDTTKDQLLRVFGTPSGVIAGILDPDRALPIVRQQVTAASIAAEAARNFGNREELTVSRAMELAKLGVTQEDARKGFGDLASRQEREQALARMSGTELTTEELQNEALLGNQSVRQRRDRVLGQERSRFQQSYVSQETGLTRSAGGSY